MWVHDLCWNAPAILVITSCASTKCLLRLIVRCKANCALSFPVGVLSCWEEACSACLVGLWIVSKSNADSCIDPPFNSFPACLHWLTAKCEMGKPWFERTLKQVHVHLRHGMGKCDSRASQFAGIDAAGYQSHQAPYWPCTAAYALPFQQPNNGSWSGHHLWRLTTKHLLPSASKVPGAGLLRAHSALACRVPRAYLLLQGHAWAVLSHHSAARYDQVQALQQSFKAVAAQPWNKVWRCSQARCAMSTKQLNIDSIVECSPTWCQLGIGNLVVCVCMCFCEGVGSQEFVHPCDVLWRSWVTGVCSPMRRFVKELGHRSLFTHATCSPMRHVHPCDMFTHATSVCLWYEPGLQLLRWVWMAW